MDVQVETLVLLSLVLVDKYTSIMVHPFIKTSCIVFNPIASLSALNFCYDLSEWIGYLLFLVTADVEI